MKENTDELLIDLLIKQATYGLTDTEQTELNKLENGRHDSSFDLTVSAISLIDEKGDEAMPSHLSANIRASAERYFDEKDASEHPSTIQPVAGVGRPSIWNWLGWAIGAAACLVLAANLYFDASSARTTGSGWSDTDPGRGNAHTCSTASKNDGFQSGHDKGIRGQREC